MPVVLNISREAERQMDATLLQAIAKGDTEAFEQLYTRFSGGLYSLVVQITRDEAEAQDALQEGFMQIWRKAVSYDSTRSSAFTWAVMIVRNKTIDRLRARQRIARTADKLLEAQDSDAQVDNTSALFPVLREQRTLVRSAVASLPEDQKEALQLSFFQGLTHEEIAAHLETPLGTIKARIRRGLIKLRDSLKGEQ